MYLPELDELKEAYEQGPKPKPQETPADDATATETPAKPRGRRRPKPGEEPPSFGTLFAEAVAADPRFASGEEAFTASVERYHQLMSPADEPENR